MLAKKNIHLIAVLMSFVLFFGGIPASDRETYFFSIHIASFKSLDNAVRKADALKAKGQPAFWQRSNIPGEGVFYRVYLGRYQEMNRAVAAWKRIKAKGLVAHLGIHYLNEPAEARPTKSLAVSKSVGKSNAATSHPAPSPLDRFVDNQDGTITDRKTNLMWIKNGWHLNFISALTWQDAVVRLRKFKHGNYSDWRLPTIKEWRSLIDTANQNPALVEPNFFENIISHMPYWSRSEYAYGIESIQTRGTSPNSYVVNLYFGSIKHQNKKEKAFVLPVRSIATAESVTQPNS